MNLDPVPHEATDLVRALEAIQRTQARWLHDLGVVVDGPDPAWQAALRRWQEHFAVLKLQLVRAELRLQHYLRIPDERRPWREFPGRRGSHHESYLRWQERIVPYVRLLRLDTRYRRLPSMIDLAGEAVVADAMTDLVALAALAETTNASLSGFLTAKDVVELEDLAFHHVLSPWKQEGLPALHDVQRWLFELLREDDPV